MRFDRRKSDICIDTIGSNQTMQCLDYIKRQGQLLYMA